MEGPISTDNTDGATILVSSSERRFGPEPLIKFARPDMSQYTKNPPLLEAGVCADPIEQFDHWLGEAQAAGMIEPTAMTLATVDANGHPSARIVLFKGVHEGGPTFYTSYRGRKAHDLEVNPNVALVFWWDRMERQVRFEGRVAKLPIDMSREYFYQRPRESQIGAITSHQSQVVASREALDQRYDDNVARLAGDEVPFPDHWGGYRVEPVAVEFWQGRLGRLHDRLRYRRDGAQWALERLEP